MGICDSQNNQNQATTNTGSINPVSTSQTVGTASKVVEESVTNENATATATAEALRAEGTPAILDTTGMDEEALNEYAKEKGIETVMFMNGGEA